MSVLTRSKRLMLQILISLDQGVQTIIFGTIYLFCGGECPSADETISSYVGRESEQGKRWAKVVERMIDGLFRPLGQPHHCRSSIEILSLKKYPD